MNKLNGKYASYPSDGYSLNILPNISPKLLAEALDDCAQYFQNSINTCSRAQSLPEGSLTNPGKGTEGCPANAKPLSAVGYNNALDLLKCNKIPVKPEDEKDFQCSLTDVPLDYALQLMGAAHCRLCACQPDTDATCNQNCNPKMIFVEQISRLKLNEWLGLDTRAVITTATFFNQNINMFSTVNQVFEIPNISTKDVIAYSAFTDTVVLFKYITVLDSVKLALEITLAVMCIYYTVTEFIELYNTGIAYFTDAWNLMDWANLIILYVVFGLRIVSYLVITGSDFDSLQNTWIDFPTLVYWSTIERDLMSTNFFLIYFKIFKYLAQIPRMDAILVTVSAALFDLGLFLVMFVVVLIGFMAAFMVCFGPFLEEWATPGSVISRLMRILLGDFDYDSLEKYNPTMAAVLFYLYIIIMFFILLNMFLAIINDSYAEVKANQSDADLLYYVNLKNRIMARLSIIFGRKKAVNQLAADMEHDLDDGIVTEDELRAILEDHPEAAALLDRITVRELMAKYDVNDDGSLTRDEVVRLLRDLALKEAEMEADALGGVVGDAADGLPAGMLRGSRRNRGALNARTDAELAAMRDKVDALEVSLNEHTKTMAKKMTTMVELMVAMTEKSGPGGGGR